MNKKKILIIIGSIVILAVSIFLVFILKNNKETIKYKVSFQTNGGTMISSQTITEGEKVVKPNDPEKEGYIFIQWTYQGKTYDFSLGVKNDIILIAEWIEKEEDIEKFVIKFDSNGGTTISNQIIEKGNKVQKPEDPKKEGYNFIEWQLDGIKYDFEKEVTSNLELVSIYEEIKTINKPNSNENTKPNNNTSNNTNITTPVTPSVKKYKVIFNSNGGSSVASQTVEQGKKVTKPSNPSRDGYNFSGWTLDGKNYDFNTAVKENITLVAKWTENSKPKYTVTFNSNGGSSVESQTVEQGKKVTKPSNPTRSGYTFSGWILNGTNYNFNTAIKENITLIAKWKNDLWEVDSNTGSIIKYYGNEKNVLIPNTIDNIKILKINSYAFENNLIESITIPTNVTKIEDEAILKSKNKKLTKIYVSDGLYKTTSWLKVLGTSTTFTSNGDSGIFIRALSKKDGCELDLISGTCETSLFTYIYNIDGIYRIYYDMTDCGYTKYDKDIYYAFTDSYTLYTPSDSNFIGWIGDNGTVPEKKVIIPKGSTGPKYYTAVCE